MRTPFRLRTVALSSAVAAGALALLGPARPAAAQGDVPTTSVSQPIVTVRGGVYLPFNSALKNASGKTLYGGGLDYNLQQKVGQSRTELSADYIERSSGGHTIRIFPVTISQFSIQSGQGGIRPYFGVGAGAYFINQTLPDSFGNNQTTNKTAIGGFLGAGLDLPSNLMIEARYHIIQKVGAYKADGLQLMAGFRF